MPRATMTFTVELDEERIPQRIEWEATESGFDGARECDALMISVRDRETGDTLGIDLWTAQITVPEMRHHVVQSLLKLADVIEESTRDAEAAGRIRAVAGEMAEA